MTPLPRCPFCGSPGIFPGLLLNGEFEPTGTKVPIWKRGFNYPSVQSPAEVCMSCGKLWGTGTLSELKSYIERYGTSELKARLAALEAGIPPTANPQARPT